MAETGLRSSCEVTSTRSYGRGVSEKSVSKRGQASTWRARASTHLLLSALLVRLLTLGLGFDGADLELKRALGKAPLEIDPLLAHLHLQVAAGNEFPRREGLWQVVVGAAGQAFNLLLIAGAWKRPQSS
jgi:hypothetical protein